MFVYTLRLILSSSCFIHITFLLSIFQASQLGSVKTLLESYTTSAELINTCSYALIGTSFSLYSWFCTVLMYVSAHKQAWEKAKVLHHDISSQNIMVDARTGQGFLNDWDTCKYEEELGKRAKESGCGAVSVLINRDKVSLTQQYIRELGLSYPH